MALGCRTVSVPVYDPIVSEVVCLHSMYHLPSTIILFLELNKRYAALNSVLLTAPALLVCCLSFKLLLQSICSVFAYAKLNSVLLTTQALLVCCSSFELLLQSKFLYSSVK